MFARVCCANVVRNLAEGDLMTEGNERLLRKVLIANPRQLRFILYSCSANVVQK